MTDAPDENTQGPTVHDRRRVDPVTGQLREPQADPAAPAAPAGENASASNEDSQVDVSAADALVVELQTSLDERTRDLQRLQAEYVNYKRRVDRDRDLTRQIGTESVLRDLLDVLDGVASARAHDELTGGFKGVADSLEKVATRYGLTAFGENGDPFDPNIHEALMHAPAVEGIEVPTCVQVLQVGYKVKDKVLRPARVAVAEPAPPSAQSATAPQGSESAETPSATPDNSGSTDN